LDSSFGVVAVVHLLDVAVVDTREDPPENSYLLLWMLLLVKHTIYVLDVTIAAWAIMVEFSKPAHALVYQVQV
jgi:hypothetical protein